MSLRLCYLGFPSQFLFIYLVLVNPLGLLIPPYLSTVLILVFIAISLLAVWEKFMGHETMRETIVMLSLPCSNPTLAQLIVINI